MLSIIVLASLTPVLILLLGSLLVTFMDERVNRKLLSIFIVFLALFMNSILLSFYMLLDIVERDFYLNLGTGTFFIIEFILLIGLIVLLFSKEEVVNIVNENLFDGLILIILIGMIGTIISSNIIVIFSSFILVITLIGVIFYFGNYPKEFKLLRLYFIGIGISIILLFIASYLMYIEFKSLILTEIKLVQISDASNILITTLLFLGIGIPCGLFPFTISHLKNYYQDSSYTNLLLFSLFSFVNVFLIVRILNVFSYALLTNGLIIIIISSIGLLTSIIFILTELFTSLDGDTFSIKKIFGYSICSDFNMFLLLSSFIVFLTPVALGQSYMNLLIFYLLILISVKTLIFYTFFPIMLETYDDNLKLLGDFWNKYKIFGIFLFLSGLIISLPLSFLSLNALITLYSIESIIGISVISMIAFIIFILYLIYIAITLVFVSISFIQIYYSNKPRYVERETIKNINSNHYIPIIIIVLLIAVLIIAYLFGNNVFYLIFRSFFLFTE